MNRPASFATLLIVVLLPSMLIVVLLSFMLIVVMLSRSLLIVVLPQIPLLTVELVPAMAHCWLSAAPLRCFVLAKSNIVISSC